MHWPWCLPVYGIQLIPHHLELRAAQTRERERIPSTASKAAGMAIPGSLAMLFSWGGRMFWALLFLPLQELGNSASTAAPTGTANLKKERKQQQLQIISSTFTLLGRESELAAVALTLSRCQSDEYIYKKAKTNPFWVPHSPAFGEGSTTYSECSCQGNGTIL